MSRFSFSSLRVRLILLVLLAIIPTVALTLYTGWKEQQTAAAAAQQDVMRLAMLASADQDLLAESTHQLLVGLARLPEVHQGDPATCSALFAYLLKQYPPYANLLVTKANGDLWCSATPFSGTVNYADRAWFQDVMGTRNFAIGGYVMGRVTRKPLVTFAYPVLDELGQVQAIIAAGMDLAWLSRFVTQTELPAGSTLTVIDGNGTVLARNLEPGKWVGQTVADVPIAKAILTRQSKGTVEAIDVDGVNRLYAFTPLISKPQVGNVYIAIGIPSAVAYDQTDQMLARNLATIGLVTVLALATAWFGGDYFILRRVNDLQRGVQRLTAGDLSARTDLTHGISELNQLARAFDQMAESLEQREHERKRAEETLRESEKRLHLITDNMLDLVAQTDLQGKFQYVSPSHKNVLGYAPEDMLGKSIYDWMHPEDISTTRAAILDALKTASPGRMELRYRHADGNCLWLESNGSLIFDDKGTMIGAVFSTRDITTRKCAEERVHQNAARATALTRTAARLNAQLHLDAVLNSVCEESAAALNVPAVDIFLHDQQHDVLSIAALTGLPQKYQTDYIPTPRARYEEYTRRMGPIIVMPDVQAIPGLSNAALYAEMNIRTIASASMLREGQLIGTLAALTFQVRQFTDNELALLQGLADQAAQAITNARLYEETRRRLEQIQALHAVDMAITSSFDKRVTFQVILDQVTRQLKVDAADILLFDPATQILRYTSGVGFRGSALQQTRLPIGEGYAGQAALERRIISVPNFVQNPNGLARSPFLASEGFASYLAVPLIAKTQIKGVLEIFQRTRLEPDPDWLDFLQTLTTQAAIAVDNSQLFDNLQRSNVELKLAYDATIEGWSHALDLRDKETEGHTKRVTNITVRLAPAVGISDAELVHIHRGALLHDIGKMGVPDSILLKPGPLTDEEWKIMRKHPVFAFEMLSPIAYLRPALDIPYCHHEKWDGTGYPRGLKGEEIPLAARVFAVVDVWDALTSDRLYRAAWSKEKTREHIQSLAGTHFDPKVVEVFFQVFREE